MIVSELMSPVADAQHGHDSAETAAKPHQPGGLSSTQDGYRLELSPTKAVAGKPTELSLRIMDPDNSAATEFAFNHGKQLHVIVARRDLSGYEHLHPVVTGDGSWKTTTTFRTAGDYRSCGTQTGGR